MPPRIPPGLGLPVTTRDFNLLSLVAAEWGSEFKAPDHGIYVFDNGLRRFDSTDMGFTGFYGPVRVQNFLALESGFLLDYEDNSPIPVT